MPNSKDESMPPRRRPRPGGFMVAAGIVGSIAVPLLVMPWVIADPAFWAAMLTSWICGGMFFAFLGWLMWGMVQSKLDIAQKAIAMVATTWGAIILVALAVMVLFSLGIVPGAVPIMFWGLVYGWMLYTYLHYRQGRQEEMLQVLITASESAAPLAPAIRAYVADRPQGVMREFWVALILFFVFPGYYWIWHRRHSFDRKVLAVAKKLENGVPLSIALHTVPGVATRETILAASVGESTGRLAQSLQGTARRRLTIIWLEVVPRFLYPLTILFFLVNIATFWMMFIGPKITRIFSDFRQTLPVPTRAIVDVGDFVAANGWAVVLTISVCAALFALVLRSPAARWHLPLLGRLYRMHFQSRFLRMLAIALGTGRSAPEALALLAGSGFYEGMLGRLLADTRRAVENGEPLAESLSRRRLVPAAAVPLMHAAQRAGNLPWALGEMADTLSDRTIRLMRRLSIVGGPLLLIVIGGLVGYLVVGMFIPIVDLITKLTEW
jgi:type IV pilus assembly protein PilC